MSKEQTPITAEEFLKHQGYEEDCDYLTGKELEEVMEQYAQSKVLEALESCDKFSIDASRLSTKEKIQFMSYIPNVSIKCNTTKQK